MTDDTQRTEQDTKSYVMRLLNRVQVVRVGPNRESAGKLAKAWSRRYDATTVEVEGPPGTRVMPDIVFIDGVAFRRVDSEKEE